MTTLNPVVPSAPAGGLGRLGWAIADSWIVAKRDLTYWVRAPERIVFGLMWPIVMVVMFGYIFGSAMTVDGGAANSAQYREFLMPGMFAQSMVFGITMTMVTVTTETAKGVTDRFRAMPMARSGVVGGRAIADMFNSLLDLALLIGCGFLIGWRVHGSLGETLAAVGLLLLLRFALIWVGIYLGLLVRSPEMANNLTVLVFPLTMLANTFVSPQLMPGWLGTIADWNPLSATVGATRELFGNPGVGGDSWIAQNSILMAVLWPLLMTAIFLPLSVRRYRRLSR